jgi:hypothetical protein
MICNRAIEVDDAMRTVPDGALDQPHLEMGFKGGDLPGNSRLRRPDFPRDSGERSRLGHTHEAPKPGQKIHKPYPIA